MQIVSKKGKIWSSQKGAHLSIEENPIEMSDSITVEKKKRRRFKVMHYNANETHINLLILKTKTEVTQ